MIQSLLAMPRQQEHLFCEGALKILEVCFQLRNICVCVVYLFLEFRQVLCMQLGLVCQSPRSPRRPKLCAQISFLLSASPAPPQAKLILLGPDAQISGMYIPHYLFFFLRGEALVNFCILMSVNLLAGNLGSINIKSVKQCK